MKKSFISVVAVIVLLTLVFVPSAHAEPAHTVETDASSVSIAIGASNGEEVTLQICASGASQPIFIDQVTADAQGAVFSLPLAQGEYTYRAYLSTSKEYVSGSFRIEPSQPSTSSTDSSTPSSTDSSIPSEPTSNVSEDASGPSTGQSPVGLLTAAVILLAALAAIIVLGLTQKEVKENA